MTTGQVRHRAAVVAALLALTLAHIGYVWLTSRGDTTRLADFQLGSVLPQFEVAEVDSLGRWSAAPLLGGDSCQVVVTFDPSCPFCGRAAAREAGADVLALPTTWVAPGDSLGSARYRAMVNPLSRVTRSTAVWQALGVRGVPGAFLVDVQHRVRQIWTYQGDEARDELADLCQGDALDRGPPVGDR